MDVRLRILCAVLALPSWMAAAGGSPLDLVMPDTRVLVGLRVDRILASPLGAQIKAELAKSDPGALGQIKAATGLDVTQDLREIIIATTAHPQKNPPTLVIIRGSFNPARFSGLAAFGVKLTRVDGLPVLAGGPKGAMAAFLDESTLIAGDAAQVRAAMARRKSAGKAPAAVVDRVRDYSDRFDAWMVSVGSLPEWKPSAAPALNAKGLNLEALHGIDQFHAGIRVSPDFELAAEILTRTEKDASELSGAIGMVRAMLQSKQSERAPNVPGLENLKLEAEGKRLLVSLALSQEEVQKAIQARREPRKPAPAPKPQTPPLAIRIQTSPTDIRTVPIPPR